MEFQMSQIQKNVCIAIATVFGFTMVNAFYYGATNGRILAKDIVIGGPQKLGQLCRKPFVKTKAAETKVAKPGNKAKAKNLEKSDSKASISSLTSTETDSSPVEETEIVTE